MKYFVFLSILISLVSRASGNHVSNSVASSGLRGSESDVGEERRLFSFTSLLNLLHHHHSGSGSSSSSASGGSDYSESSSGSYTSESDSNSGASGYTDSTTAFDQSGAPSDGGNGASQSAQRVATLALYIIGAAAVAGGVAALIYNKPKTDTESAENGIVLDDGTVLGSIMSGINNLGDLSVLGDATTFDSGDASQGGGNRLWAAGLGAFGGLAALGGFARNTETEEGDFVEMSSVTEPGPVMSHKGYAI